MSEQDREKLKVLLDHWIEHNKEHSQEFRKWAEKARSLNEQAVYDRINTAASQIDKANEFLAKALDELG